MCATTDHSFISLLKYEQMKAPDWKRFSKNIAAAREQLKLI